MNSAITILKNEPAELRLAIAPAPVGQRSPRDKVAV